MKPDEVEAYDAFISYSRQDVAFARVLERLLEAYRPPRELNLPARNLRVFRDEGDLTGTEYFTAIDGKLDASASCILLCSPRAAASEFVNDEVRRFIEKKGADRVIPVLIDGLPNNEAGAERASLAAFPPALVEAMAMPLATDYRAADPSRQRLSKPPYENQWYTVLANLLGISRERLEQRDRVRQARRRRLITVGSAVIIALLSALSVIALVQRRNALVSLAQSESRQLADRALNPPLDDPVYGLVHALEAAERAETFEAETALRATAIDHRVHAVLGHDAPVASAWFRPGVPSPGETLTLTSEGRALVWDNVTGMVRRDLTGDTLDATEARFDPTGGLAIVGRRSGTVDVWALDDATHRRIAAHTAPVRVLAVTPDGSRLATGGDDGHVRLWTLPGGEPIAGQGFREERCAGNRADFGALAFSPDGALLAIGICDGRTALRDARTLAGAVVLRAGASSAAAEGLTFSPTANRLAVIRGAAVQFWDTRDRTLVEEWWPDLLVDRVTFLDGGRRALALGVGQVAEWHGPDAAPSDTTVDTLHTAGLRTIRDAQPARDGRWLLTGGADRRGTLWHLASGTPVAQLSGHRHEILDVDLSEDGRWALTASADSTVRVWQIDPAAHISFTRAGRDDEFRYSEDGRYVLHWRTTGSLGGPISVWDRVAETVTLHVDSTILGPGFAPGGLVTAVDILGGHLKIWDRRTGELRASIPGGTGYAFADSGTEVARWGFSGPLVVWNLASGRADTVLALEGRPGYVRFSSSGTRLAVATPDGTIMVWSRDSLTGSPRVLRGHRGAIQYAVFEGDSLLLTASTDSTARIWPLDDDRPPRVLSGHGGAVQVVAIRGDGRQAVTGSDDWTARVWDVAAGTETALLRGHTDAIDWVQYDPGQTRILTKSQPDSTARLWDPATGRQLAILRDADGHGIDWVWFEADSLMTGSKRGTIAPHPISFDALVERANRQLPVNLTRRRRAQILGCITPELARQLGYRWCDRWWGDGG